MKLFCGISTSPKSSQVAIVNEQGGVAYSRILPNDLQFILKSSPGLESPEQSQFVVAGLSPQWLVNGLVVANYTVYVPTTTASEESLPAGFINGNWNAEWLAIELQSYSLSDQYFYLAVITMQYVRCTLVIGKTASSSTSPMAQACQIIVGATR